MKFPVFAAIALTGILTAAPSPAQATFQHQFVADSMPGNQTGLGGMGVGDFDHDGKIDIVAVNRGDNQLYLFTQSDSTAAPAPKSTADSPSASWTRHRIGKLPSPQLGMTILDVDHDGWLDIVVGGLWFQNPHHPQAPFTPHIYDPLIHSEMHDVVAADIDHDGKTDIVATGDGEGLYWYAIPSDPTLPWKRTTITLDVLKQNVDLHGGPAPNGVGDLNGDGLPDIVLADRWLENQHNGQQWIAHRLPFGHRGIFGIAVRSWIEDVNGDGHPDIILCDSDTPSSSGAWLENDGKPSPSFWVHYLPNKAPGTRGSFHALWYADFDGDGLKDILVIEQEDPDILPVGATPRWYLFRRLPGKEVNFAEEILLDEKLGGHDVRVLDLNGDGKPDIVSKEWNTWPGNSNQGRSHLDILWNTTKLPPTPTNQPRSTTAQPAPPTAPSIPHPQPSSSP